MLVERRRALVGLLGFGIGLRAPAAPPARIGVLEGMPPEVFAGRLEVFKEGLRAAGYAEPRDVQFVYRTANGRLGDLPALATELVKREVDVIFAPTTAAAVAARDATRNIPIVFAVSADPIGTRLVASLARPGGNLTGMSTSNTDVATKRLQLLRELLNGKAARIAVVFNPGDESNVIAVGLLQAAARTLGLAVPQHEVRSLEDLERAFTRLASDKVDGVILAAGALTDSHAHRITAFAARARIPTMYGAPEFVEAGGLVSYSATFADNYRRAADYVARILRGAKPADLPVEQSRAFQLVINRKTTATLGIPIPMSLLVQARVID